MMRIKYSRWGLLAGFIFLGIGSSLASTWYVSQTSPQDGPGTAWNNAFHILQDGVDAAASNDTVLVTNGTYDVGGMEVNAMSNRVVITQAVSVQSVNGPEFTLIIGEGPIGSNAVRCVYLAEGSELIGFTLTNGHTHASDMYWWEKQGGGVFSNGGHLSHCIISGNSASDGGGGVFFSQNGTVYRCTISLNSAPHGGGVAVNRKGLLADCIISSNSAYYGGGVRFWEEGGVTTNCTISSNIATNGGGGACHGGGTFVDCTISSNSANHGGGIAFSRGGTATNCTISSNSANSGGGINFYQGGMVSSCEITENDAMKGGGIFYDRGGMASTSSIRNNSAPKGGGVYHSNGGTLNGCTVNDNRATGSDGGGIFIDQSGLVGNCVVYENMAIINGGGINASQGGTISHCTVAENSATSGGGINADPEAVILNSIVWDNPGGNWRGSGGWTNSCTTPSIGINTITTDPQFVGLGNYRLPLSSPCIDVGFDTGLTDDIVGMARPLDSNNDGTALPDIGAYELVNLAADSDRDGLNDGIELDVTGTSLILTNTDGDAASDYEEYVADTDGTNPNDFFQIVEINGATVSFQSSAIRHYTLYWSTDLFQGNWTSVRGQTDIMGSGGIDTLTDAYNESFIDPACFYRVEVEIP